MKNLSKKIAIIVTILLLIITITTIVFADNTAGGAIDPIEISGKPASTSAIQSIGGQIVTIVSVIGSLASVVVLVVIGLKYMMGSTEEKAEYKKTLLPYVIGATLVFAASALAGVIYNFAKPLKS